MQSKKGPKLLIGIGVFLTLGPLWGFLGTIIGMVRAFTAIETSSAAPRPEDLASDISVALLATVAGWIVCPIGIGLLVGGVVWLTRDNGKTYDDSSPDPHSRAGG